jgi:hypothetical protein
MFDSIIKILLDKPITSKYHKKSLNFYFSSSLFLFGLSFLQTVLSVLAVYLCANYLSFFFLFFNLVPYLSLLNKSLVIVAAILVEAKTSYE